LCATLAFPSFVIGLSAQGKQLPGYVVREFYGYLKCGRLGHVIIGGTGTANSNRTLEWIGGNLHLDIHRDCLSVSVNFRKNADEDPWYGFGQCRCSAV